MSSLFSSSDTQSSTSSTTPNISSFLQNYLNQAISGAGSGLNQVAGTTADQQSAYDLIRNLAGSTTGSSGISAASSYLQSLLNPSGGITSSDISSFMNPYTSDVTDTAIRKLQAAGAQQLQGINDQAITSGSFGGSRNALQLANTQQGLQTQIADTAYQGQKDAYDAAVNAALQSKNLGISGATGLVNASTAGTSDTLSKANALLSSGQTQQTQAQNELDVPLKNNQYLTRVLSSLAPMQIGSNTKGTVSTTSTGSPFGALVGGIGALGSMGVFKNGGPVSLSDFAEMGRNYPYFDPTSATEPFDEAMYNYLLEKANKGASSKTIDDLFNAARTSEDLYSNPDFRMPIKKHPQYANGGLVDSLANILTNNLRAGADTQYPPNRPLAGLSSIFNSIKEDYLRHTREKELQDELANEQQGSQSQQTAATSVPTTAASLASPQDTTAGLPVDISSIAQFLPESNGSEVSDQTQSTQTSAPAEQPKEKGFFERLFNPEHVNEPLLAASLALMSSNKNFFNALGDAGTVGLHTYQAAQDTAFKQAQDIKKLNLLEKQVGAQQQVADARTTQAMAAWLKSNRGDLAPGVQSTILSTANANTQSMIANGMFNQDSVEAQNFMQNEVRRLASSVPTTGGLQPTQQSTQPQQSNDPLGLLGKK